MPETHLTRELVERLVSSFEHAANSMDAMASESAQLRADVRHNGRKRNRRDVIVAVAVVLLALIAVSNRLIFSTINDVISPGGKRFRESQQRSQSVIANLVDEGDCRQHRVVVSLPPPPDPTKPCRDQTPHSVYLSPLCALPPPQGPCPHENP